MEEKREQNQKSSTLDQPKALQKCISIFEGAKNDNERFAGLLLVTQLVRSDTLDRAERRRLFDAVGFTFINRLLTTAEVPQDCPENVFKSLALTILACFATDDELLFHPQMVAKLPLIGELISGTPGEILDDCYQILMSFASSVKGCAHMVRMGSTRALCRIVEERSCSTALEILLRMLHFCPRETWQEEGSELVRVLPSLCKKFRDVQDASKFEVCKTLVSFLSGAENSSFDSFLAEAEVGNDWQSDLSKGLQEILQSKISSEQRDPALILTAFLIDLIGMKWMLTHCMFSNMPRQADEKVNVPELFVIAVSLASVEIRMILENSSSKEEIITKRSLLSACYDILERTINFTASEVSIGDDEGVIGDYTTLSKKTVSRVYSQVKEAVESIMAFLDRAAHHQQDISSFSGDEKHVLIASVRVIGAWMAEETSALQTEIHKLLPFLLKLAKDALEKDVPVKESSAIGSQTHTPEEGNPCKLAGNLSGLHLRENDTSQPVILRFLLPGLCHLSADESALKVLVRNQAHAMLGKYFFSEWKKWMNKMEDADARITLTTLLGIFLNFAVVKPDLVRKEKVFQDLCQHAMSAVPELISHPEHVFLLANLVVLGLMLVRQQHVEKSLADNASNIELFFRAVLELLRSGIQLKSEKEEARPNQLALSCKTNWDDISELWFLGLQVLTSLLSQSPVLRVVVKESGWCEEIETQCTAKQSPVEIQKALLSFLKEFKKFQF